jgi:atlastin
MTSELTPPPELTPESPVAVPIVSIGAAASAYAFQFHDATLQAILQQIPPDCPVAVVSVVGAFRTGKSFLLSWLLRYLTTTTTASTPSTTTHNHSQSYARTTASTPSTTTGSTRNTPWYQQDASLGNNGFEWKAGSERNTTGIWMWSRPFFLPSTHNDNNDDNDSNQPATALLLVDTQGMFDHETTMALTASIFGLSTLLSSLQIYNVDKRIQEDHLQQLALFSEYARTAMGVEEHNNNNNNDDNDNNKNDDDDKAKAAPVPPFQRMEFLVRDWQHFDDDLDDTAENSTDTANLERMEASMTDYLRTVLSEREASDLKDTRAQIASCFDEITCYGLCHPGFAVTKKKFTGDVAAMEPLFVKLLDRYCQRIFAAVQPKRIHGRTLTAAELGSYIAAYAALFASGANFPTAATLLEATSSANNTNAVQLAVAEYTSRMERVAGPRCSNFLASDVLVEEAAAAQSQALRVFTDVANFGALPAIAKARLALESQLTESFRNYEAMNEGRNPLRGVEVYIVPALLAVASYVLRTVLDVTCAPHATVCQVGRDIFHHSYMVVLLFMAIVAVTKYHQLKEVFGRAWQAFHLVMDGGGGGGTSLKQD